jgi:nucleoside-diphosphate-sugar epimerase
VKTALIFGSTGLVGSNLLTLLIKDDYYTAIKIFVRSKVNINDPKVEIINLDFNKLNEYSHLIKGDDCFFCIGTTKKQTPNNDEYRNIEYNFPVNIAEIAKNNNVRSFMYVSSLGSNPNTKNTYLKNKGEAEEFLKKLNFYQLSIIRPSFLLGDRKEFRLGEIIGKTIFKKLSFLFQGSLRKFRAIESKNVAKAMIVISKNNYQDIYFDSKYLQDISNKN